MINPETQLINTAALTDKTFQYNYTFINCQKEEIDIESVKTQLHQELIRTIRESPRLSNLREKNVTFNYRYTDNKDNFLFEFMITPRQYK